MGEGLQGRVLASSSLPALTGDLSNPQLGLLQVRTELRWGSQGGRRKSRIQASHQHPVLQPRLPPAPNPLDQGASSLYQFFGRPASQSSMKLTALLLCCGALWLLQDAVAAQAPAKVLPHRFLLQCLEQVKKIQAQGWALREQLCASYQLCHPEELVLLGHSLGIPRAGLSSCSSEALQLTGCLDALHRGLFLYQGLLQALAGITPELAPTVNLLKLDVADFATNVWQQMKGLGMAPTVQPTLGLLPTFTSAFQRRAGGVLVASSLQNFLEQAYQLLCGLTES
ncbi:granulocyte colony-stimulating factor [Suncus etruscus]|uniref:granulocyte colony-stimulating factor n=1 Tax=Suncus etruscus TaxID=109475 RepID=UPI00210FBE7A|nr:granulocyte colony-stimulating factor [Suncus etruscus]